MIQKLIKNFKLVAVLYILLLIVLVFTSSFSQSKEFALQTWWILIVGPILLRFFNWFTYLKQKAFNYGYNSTSKSIEKLEQKIDKKRGYSEKAYQELVKNSLLSKEEAKAVRDNFTDVQKQFISRLSDDHFIPLYTYEKGLPGGNLMKASSEDHLISYAKITGEHLDFYQVTLKEDINTNKGQKFSSIPISSIIKIEIVDLRSGRALKRIGVKTANKFMLQLANAGSSTRINTKVFSATACKLIIYYLNEDGVLMPAVFNIPTNSRFGKSAMKSLQTIRHNIDVFGKLGQLDWDFLSLDDDNSSALIEDDGLDEEDIDDEGFEFNDVSIMLGDTRKLLNYVNLFAPTDSALVSAKLSAEMIAALTQKNDFKLTISTNQTSK